MNFTPASASTSSDSLSTAVSGSQSPSGSRSNRARKSSIPQRTCVTLSRRVASGMIMWLKTWPHALPWPRASTLARSASMILAYTSGRWRSSQAKSVGPMLNEIFSKLLPMSSTRFLSSTRRAAVFGA